MFFKEHWLRRRCSKTMASGEAKARLFAGGMGAGRHVIGGAGGLFQTRFVVLLRTQGGLLSA